MSGEAASIPLRDEVEIRLRADESSRRPVVLAFATALVWLLIGSLFGNLASLQMHWPEFVSRYPWLTFGRSRSAHLNTMAYGWASLALVGVAVWMLPRLIHAQLRLPRLATAGVLIWNLGLAIGVVLLLGGRFYGLEWLELDLSFSDPLLVVGGGFVGIALLATLRASKVEHLYVTVWYVMAAFLWFPVLFVIGNWPFYDGVESAAVNWFYAHNALGLWFSAIGVGIGYYFIPKVLGRPVYSYQLSLLGFWTLAFFYSLNGMHHLIGGPLPTWMITTSVVASVLMLIPVLAVAVNHHMTMIGRFGALRYSPTLRFIVLGAMAYTAVSLQGIFTSLREVNRVTHFTQWTIAHSHVGLYAFITFVLFGSMYYILPRLTRREWPSASLIRWHFWLALGGIALYVVALTVAGVFQGLALLDSAAPFSRSVAAVYPGLLARSVAGVALTVGHAVFAWHVWLILRGPEAARETPLFHEVTPVIYRIEDAGEVS